VKTSSESAAGNAVCYSSVTLQGHEYHVGDSAYFNPDSFTFSVKLPPAAKKSKQDQADAKPVLRSFHYSSMLINVVKLTLIGRLICMLFVVSIFSCFFCCVFIHIYIHVTKAIAGLVTHWPRVTDPPMRSKPIRGERAPRLMV